MFKQIGDELRTQYMLAYYPKQRADAGEFRRIEVRVASDNSEGIDGIKVRHRTGYYVRGSK